MTTSNEVTHVVNLKMVIACDIYGTVGDGTRMPWATLREDLKRFKQLTDGQAVVMGRATFESLPTFPRGLPNRRCYVISGKYCDKDFCIPPFAADSGFKDPNVIHVASVHDLYERVAKDIVDGIQLDNLWLIGGVKVWHDMFYGLSSVGKTIYSGLGTSQPTRTTVKFTQVNEIHLSLVDTPQRGNVYWRGIQQIMYLINNAGPDRSWNLLSTASFEGGLATVNGVSTPYPGYTYYHLKENNEV